MQIKPRSALPACLVLVILALALPSSANASVDLINSQGATAPCIGIGPIGGPVAEYCAQQYEANGFVRIAQVGVTGLTLGDSGDQDGVVTAVAPDSAAARAGFIVGDVIASVDGQPVRPSPGAVASQQLFGKVGDKVKITLVRAGSPMTLAVGRTLQAEPAGPTSTNPLIAIKPLVDWKGRFVPCIGAGPLGFAAIAFCNNHFKPYGFYPVTVAGGPGLEMDLARADAAVVKSVDPQSPAALAGVQPGDEITAIGGLDIKDSRAQVANSLMFGKIGDRRRVIVQRAGRARPLTLVLAAKVQP